MSCMDIRKYMAFKEVNQIKLIGEMKSFKKSNCNIRTQEHLTILKHLHDKNATLIDNNLGVYGVFWHKKTLQ